MDGPNCEIDRLPVACLSHVLSFTSPRDSSRAAVVSPTFRQAADSDIVWSRFLPPDYLKILSRAVDSVSFSSCKELYFMLCDSVLIDGGEKVFPLEKETGAKCFILGAKGLRIPYINNDEAWRWVSLPESRFTEVLELVNGYRVEVHCSINPSELSPNTTYKSYLIFKPAENEHEHNVHVLGRSYRARTWISGSKCFVTQIFKGILEENLYRAQPEVQDPQGRLDGWMEVELGEFYIEDGSEGDVSMSFEHTSYPPWRSGIIVEGVQVRLK